LNDNAKVAFATATLERGTQRMHKLVKILSCKRKILDFLGWLLSNNRGFFQ